jgi:phage recombination protein Bet
MSTAQATEIVRYTDSFGADVELSISDIRRSLCPKATDQEAANFLQLCRGMGLNPFVRDAYLIKYGDKEASMVVGKDAFTKRADAHPQFGGMESGVIVRIGDKEPVNRKGTLVLDGESLVGGWARVARSDRKLDTDTTVSFKEFDTGRSMWQKMPGTMIEKVAIVKALRTAFPATFSGLYDQAEMGIDLTADMEPEKTERYEKFQKAIADAGGDDGPEMSDAPGFEEDPVVEAAEDATVAHRGLVQAAEDLGAVQEEVVQEKPAACTREGHGPGIYGVVFSDATQESRWAHTYKYQEIGSEDVKTGWCIYEGPIPVPTA